VKDGLDAVFLRQIIKTYRRGKRRVEVLHGLDLTVASMNFLP
jgi:hypothetical protein